MLNDRGEQILARFPGPVTVTPVLTLTRGLIITGSMLFAIACLWGVWRGWQGSRLLDLGPGVGRRIFRIPQRGQSRGAADQQDDARPRGLRARRREHRGTRKKRFPWREVSAFEVLRIRGDFGVAFDDARKGGGMLDGVNRALGFRNSTLLEDYGLGEDQFAELLNHWRDRALAEASGDRGPTAP